LPVAIAVFSIIFFALTPLQRNPTVRRFLRHFDAVQVSQ
jgi:hypothetical protein